MKRTAIIAAIVLLVILFGYWFIRYSSYYVALNDEEKNWLVNTFIPLEISGVIYELNEPLNRDCFSNLIIKKNDGEKFASGICSCKGQKSLTDFASVGDSVHKDAGSRKILVKKKTGEIREFDFPFCDL